MTFTGLVYKFQIQRLSMTFPVLTLAELWYMCKRTLFSPMCFFPWMLRLFLALDLFNTVMADFTVNFPLLDRLKLAIPIKSLTLTRLLVYMVGSERRPWYVALSSIALQMNSSSSLSSSLGLPVQCKYSRPYRFTCTLTIPTTNKIWYTCKYLLVNSSGCFHERYYNFYIY